MYCKKCGKELDDKAVICTDCGTITENYAPKKTGRAASSYRNEFYAPYIGLILVFVFPIVGLIVSISNFRRAKAVYGETKYALLGIVLGALLLALSALVLIVDQYKYYWVNGLPVY